MRTTSCRFELRSVPNSLISTTRGTACEQSCGANAKWPLINGTRKVSTTGGPRRSTEQPHPGPRIRMHAVNDDDAGIHLPITSTESTRLLSRLVSRDGKKERDIVARSSSVNLRKVREAKNLRLREAQVLQMKRIKRQESYELRQMKNLRVQKALEVRESHAARLAEKEERERNSAGSEGEHQDESTSISRSLVRSVRTNSSEASMRLPLHDSMDKSKSEQSMKYSTDRSRHGEIQYTQKHPVASSEDDQAWLRLKKSLSKSAQQKQIACRRPMDATDDNGDSAPDLVRDLGSSKNSQLPKGVRNIPRSADRHVHGPIQSNIRTRYLAEQAPNAQEQVPNFQSPSSPEPRTFQSPPPNTARITQPKELGQHGDNEIQSRPARTVKSLHLKKLEQHGDDKSQSQPQTITQKPQRTKLDQDREKELEQPLRDMTTPSQKPQKTRDANRKPALIMPTAIQQVEIRLKEENVRKQGPSEQLSADEMKAFKKLLATANAQVPSSTVYSHIDLAKTSAGAVSILEELFPQELSREPRAFKGQRHIPRHPLEFPLARSPEEEYEEQEYSREQVKDSYQGIPGMTSVQPHSETGEIAVVVLNKASKHLTEHDFRRCMPGGSHIKGWASQGELLKIIRSRDVDTLERNRSYFLVFSHSAAAQKYVLNATMLHRYSQKNSPRSMFSPVSPPPTLDKETGQAKLSNPVYTYTLMSPSHELSIKIMPQPLAPIIWQIIRDGQAPGIVQRQQSPYEVMIRLSNVLVPKGVIDRIIREDGIRRGTYWELAKNDKHSGVRVVTDSDEPNSDSEFERRDLRRFIVSFTNQEEATRFATLWHRRDVTNFVGRFIDFTNDRGVMCFAETTW